MRPCSDGSPSFFCGRYAWPSPDSVRIHGRDPRDVVIANGRGHITDRTMLGARVELDSVRAEEPTARFDTRHVLLINGDGQMPLIAPRDGDLAIELRDPKHTALLALALAAVVINSIIPAPEHRR